MNFPITSKFMQQEAFRGRIPHRGIDFSMPNGTPLRSIQDGEILRIADFGKLNAGKTVFVKWDDGKTAIYGHLSEFSNIRVGQHINRGDLIGYSGNTGNVVGANGGYHLHFGLKGANGQILDPSPYINDIQNMNNLNYVLDKIPDKVQQFCEKSSELVPVKVDFFQFMSKHMNSVGETLTNLKLQMISHLSYDVLFIQILENLGQFFTTHAKLLNLIITNVF